MFETENLSRNEKLKTEKKINLKFSETLKRNFLFSEKILSLCLLSFLSSNPHKFFSFLFAKGETTREREREREKDDDDDDVDDNNNNSDEGDDNGENL